MKKLHLNMALLFVGSTLFSQVGINTSSPEATLDVRGKNHLGAVTSKDGVLVPRVNDLSASGSVNGQLVYLIADNGTFTKGFHYWNGNVWTGFGNAIAGDTTNDAWINDVANTRVKLNSQSDGSTARPAGTEMVILDTGSVGIGTSNPNRKLHVAGALLTTPNTTNDGATGSNSEPVTIELYGKQGTGGDTPVGGVKMLWYNQNPVSMNILRGSASNDGAGIGFNISKDGTTESEAMRIARNGNVGIGIDSPTNKTDINGDLRVRTMITGQDTEYILSADSNGVLHRTTLTSQSVGDTNTSGSTIRKNQYFATRADGTKTISAGIVEVRMIPFDGSSTLYNYPQLRLNTAPASNISVVVLNDETYNSGGTQGSAVTLNFTPSNYTTWRTVGNGTLNVDEKNILTFSIPGTTDLYRVTCYVTGNSATSGQERFYNLIVEKF
ncbi:hypothetical protein [Chryseobacterium sp. JM1]|uniref:hypothetical protein n=1 Tax=Chryseobacterium sp. JM1 TaxID=1233950 RepID=UPI000ABB3E46|nr:hypothetical protein [Chryseobacterium sp. JM1]